MGALSVYEFIGGPMDGVRWCAPETPGPPVRMAFFRLRTLPPPGPGVAPDMAVPLPPGLDACGARYYHPSPVDVRSGVFSSYAGSVPFVSYELLEWCDDGHGPMVPSSRPARGGLLVPRRTRVVRGPLMSLAFYMHAPTIERCGCAWWCWRPCRAMLDDRADDLPPMPETPG